MENNTRQRETRVETGPAAQHSWTDARGNRHTMLSWDTGEGDTRTNLQIHVERQGNWITLRMEEWDANVPDLLRVGTTGFTLESR